MSDLVRRPARHDYSLRTGDDVTVAYQVTDGTDPVDITGWTLEADQAEVSKTDAAAGRFTVTPDTSEGVLTTWRVCRTAPDARTLLEGRLLVSPGAGDTTADTEWTLVLTAAADVTLEVGGTIDQTARDAVAALTDPDDFALSGGTLTIDSDGTLVAEVDG